MIVLLICVAVWTVAFLLTLFAMLRAAKASDSHERRPGYIIEPAFKWPRRPRG